MIPHIAKNKLAEFCDGFCESTAFTSEEIDKIFSNASKNGLKLKLHTEQFNNVGGLDTAFKHHASSVDHLEVLLDQDVNRFSNSETVAVLLPGVSLFLDYQFAPARKLIEHNAIVALATDYNPGSSHILNLHLIMSLAAIKMKMKIEEIINAVTINAAKALNREQNIGSIEIGKQADFAVFNVSDYSEIIYNVGRNLISSTVKDGEIIFQK
jgi:imidazolonepropionase